MHGSFSPIPLIKIQCITDFFSISPFVFRAIGYSSLPPSYTPATTSHPSMCGACAAPLPIPFPISQLQWPKS